MAQSRGHTSTALATSILLLLVLLPSPVHSQVVNRLRRAAERAVESVPSLDDLRERDPLTSEPADAVTAVPFLDGFQPDVSIPMLVAPRTPDYGFLLEPGVYSYEAEGFCLKSGTYRPGPGGKGYLYAPIHGPMADVVGSILHNSWRHPEVIQRDIQVLLWAVVASTRFQDMPPRTRAVARALLSDDQVQRLRVEGIAVDLEERLARVVAQAPEPLRSTLETEARLRRILAEGEGRYEEIEAVAIRAGAPSPQADTVPAGRWSYHPEGYFVSYAPRFYQQVRVTISVPPETQLEWDDLGRISSVEDPRGNRISVRYDDVEEDRHGFHGFDSLSFSAVPLGRVAGSVGRRLWVRESEEPRRVERTWTGIGGTYVTLADAQRAGPGIGWRPSAQVLSLSDWFDTFSEGSAVVFGDDERRRLESVALFAQAVGDVALGGTATDDGRFGQAAVRLVYLAWQRELKALMGRAGAGGSRTSMPQALQSDVDAGSGPSALPLESVGLAFERTEVRSRRQTSSGVQASAAQAVIMPQIGRYAQRLAAGRFRPDALWDVDIAVDMWLEDNPGASEEDEDAVRETFLATYPGLFQQTGIPDDLPVRQCPSWACNGSERGTWHARVTAVETIPAGPPPGGYVW